MVKFTFEQWRHFSEDFPIVFSTDHKNLHILQQQDQAAFTQTNPMELILLILWLLHSVCTGFKALDSKCSFLQATIFSSSTYYTVVALTVLQPSHFWMHHIFLGEVGRNSVIPGLKFPWVGLMISRQSQQLLCPCSWWREEPRSTRAE